MTMMNDMSMSNAMVDAAAGTALPVATPMDVEAGATPCTFPSEPVAKQRALMLLLHADFALFQPGGVCEKARAAEV
jgi:hypothetical protein